MSQDKVVLGFTFKLLEHESVLDSLNAMDDGFVIAIHPETQLVTIREGKLKRNVKLYTGLHEVRNVYFLKTHRRGCNQLRDELPLTKKTLQMAFLGDLDDEKYNISRLREILRYKQLFPKVYAMYEAAIPDLAERIERESSKELAEV